MRPLLLLPAMALAPVLPGCASAPMTQSQLDAMQVRQVEAAPDRAFAAASSALLDAGYIVHVSDGDAGLLTGEKRVDPAKAANVAVIILAVLATNHYHDIPPTYHAVSVQVMPLGAERSSVRIRPFLNGRACPCNEADSGGRETVSQLWVLMQRQVLMKEPAHAETSGKGM
jgi:hypothetical protein